MQTRLTHMLGCRYPIIQTAMGWVADAKLVAATTSAGGFGFLAGAVMTAKEVEEGILEIKALTDGAFGVNFHMYMAQAPDIVDLCVKYGVRAVSYSRSPVPALIEKLKAAGIVCIPTVGATKHAVKAVTLGADAVVVQGSEGGGHTGAVASTILLPDVLAKVQVPVISCGWLSRWSRIGGGSGDGCRWHCHGNAVFDDRRVASASIDQSQLYACRARANPNQYQTRRSTPAHDR